MILKTESIETVLHPCNRSCGGVCPCLEEVDKISVRHFFRSVWRDLEKMKPETEK